MPGEKFRIPRCLVSGDGTTLVNPGYVDGYRKICQQVWETGDGEGIDGFHKILIGNKCEIMRLSWETMDFSLWQTDVLRSSTGMNMNHL